jgi:hypothetical protein
MPTNNYFGNKLTSFPQQQLLNDLTTEVIKINGVDLLYLPRTFVKKDTLMDEDVLSKFSKAYEVEMYINSNEGFSGEGDMISKFGLDVKDELILVVNKERFFSVTGLPAPREGDVIYLPMTQGVFEIKFVEDEKPFYSLGKNTVFEITCETFVYNEEKFEIDKLESGEIFDKIEREHAITMTITTETSADNYTVDAFVYQGESLSLATAKGMVASTTSTTIKIFNIVGTFVKDQLIKEEQTDIDGNTVVISKNCIRVDDQDLSTSHSDNKEFELDGDSILDFSESDPWSEGDL